MSYQRFHFNGSQQLFSSKAMVSDLAMTCEYVYNALKHVQLPTILRVALDDMGWHQSGVWNSVGGHSYRYVGCKRGVGIQACLDDYMHLSEALFRLQLGYDQKQIVAGILLLTPKGAQLDQTTDLQTLITQDIQALSPTINLPVCVFVYDLSDEYDLDIACKQTIKIAS